VSTQSRGPATTATPRRRQTDSDEVQQLDHARFRRSIMACSSGGGTSILDLIPVDAIKAISPNAAEPQTTNLCSCCGGRMVIIERFERGATPHYRASPPTPAIRIDTS
jgi:hypothetical protein